MTEVTHFSLISLHAEAGLPGAVPGLLLTALPFVVVHAGASGLWRVSQLRWGMRGFNMLVDS